MKMVHKILVGFSLVLASTFALADGDLEDVILKYGTGSFDLGDGNGTKEYLLIDVDDAVATECAIYPIGNDVVWMVMDDTSMLSKSVISFTISAFSAGSTVKIGYHTVNTTATLGVDACILDSMVVY